VNREKDILQIRKYLNGELDGRAMHELEHRALDDPFLADALEGYEQASDQQPNLKELNERLHQRIHDKKVKRIIPWKPLSIAASILIILAAGIWYFSGQQAAQPKLVAQNIKPEKKEQPVVSTPSPATATVADKNAGDTVQVKQSQPKQYAAAAKAVNSSRQMANADIKTPAAAEPAPTLTAEQQAAEIYKPQKDSVTANEIAVNSINQKKATPVLKEVAVAKAKDASPETLVQSRAEGVNVTPSDSKLVTGVVMGSDGQPITGATVKVIGRPFGVVTDVHGKFALTDVSKNQILAVNYIGYQGKKVKVGTEDSLNISLEPQNSSLNEVVVTGYSAKKDDNGGTVADAHPGDGWHAYNEYLKKNAQSPDGKTGKVKVSFTVDANGSLSQFKVTKSLSDAADKKAIDLITNGPAWVAGNDGKPKEVKVSVSFR
jgi:TonB family protein